MNDSATCHNCGEGLHPDDDVCPSCGARRPDEDLATARAGWATQVMEEGGVGEEGGAEDAGVPEAWPGVRRELEGATHGEFEVVRELGRGGMAAVYLARDLALDRPVAIKVMAPGLLLGPGMVERFRQEAVTIASLHHPNIVTIHTVRQAENLHFFVMQLVEGGSLEDLLRRPDPLSLDLTRSILFQVGTGLAYAHDNGVIHRDIKPGNVLLDLEGNAILTDFGIAKVRTTTNLTQTGSTIGTPQYMSPEQCLAGELSPASDQYSLGVLAYEMLTGRTPFSGTPFAIMQAHTSSAPADIRTYRPDCPEETSEAVLKMLAKDPSGRFPGVTEAIEAIGGHVPGPRDPLRQELAELVRGFSGRLSVPPPGPSRGSPAGPPQEVSPGAARPSPPPGQRIEDPSLEPTLVAEAPLPSEAAKGKAKGKRSRVAAFAALGIAALAAVTFAVSTWSPFGGGPAVPSEDAPESPPPSVASVTLPNSTESLLVGATLTLRALVAEADGRPLPSQDVTWWSDDSSVVSVVPVEDRGEEGLLTGMAAGSALVMAEAGGIVDSVRVTVSQPAAVEQASVSPTAEDQSPSTTPSVRDRIESITIVPPAQPVQAGQRLVVRSRVSSQPEGYMGNGGLSWTSSDPGVAAVSSMGSDSVVLALLGEGETVLTVRGDDAQSTLGLQVAAAPPEVSLELSVPSAFFEAVEGGPAPTAQTIQLMVTGNASPSVGIIRYEGGGRDWLRQTLGAEGGRGTVLRIGVDLTGLAPGDYRASIPVSAADVTRTLEVSLAVRPNPALEAVAPTETAAREVSALLDAYVAAINDRDASRAQALFPSLDRSAIRELLDIPETDQFYLALVPGSLRLGIHDETLDGDVMSSVLGPDGQGETHRVTYTFSRGDEGWFIVSFRAGGG
ncbi:MAG: protein kinase [Gemmatimonadota bacterium]|jgi:serine/threonine-protein kinase